MQVYYKCASKLTVISLSPSNKLENEGGHRDHLRIYTAGEVLDESIGVRQFQRVPDGVDYEASTFDNRPEVFGLYEDHVSTLL